MAGIFLSWSAPDQAQLDKLKRLLEGVGFPIWEYRDEVAPGQQIPATVVDAIQGSIATIACFSDATVDREWLNDEISWAYMAYGKDTRRILPVWIGPHPEKKLPPLIKKLQISTVDLTSEAERERFVKETLPGILGLPAPLVIPAALFAMNQTESEQLFARLLQDEDARGKQLLALCEQLGMKSPPKLIEQWSQRYGNTADDFSPFAGQQRLIDVVQATVDDANAIRLQHHHRPIVLRWMDGELRGDKGPDAKKTARGRWKAGRPLLVVDSVSTLDDKLLNVIDKLPNDLATILWIPPYTLHTNGVEALLRQSASELQKLSDAFDDWPKSEQRVAFDAPTSLSMRLWLHRTLVDLRDQNPPVGSAVSGVQEAIGGPTSLKSLTTSPRQVPNAFSTAGR
jgi:hypothetical protein